MFRKRSVPRQSSSARQDVARGMCHAEIAATPGRSRDLTAVCRELMKELGRLDTWCHHWRAW